jgi:hypothetical protein
MGDVGGICPQAKRRQPVGPIRVRGQSIGDIEELGLRQTNQGTAEKRAKRERVACVGERARQGNDTGSAWRKLKAAQVNWRLLLAIAELAGGECLEAKCVEPRRFERYIDAYLTTETVSVWHAVERLGKAIHDEHAKRREGEDWSLAKDYVRSVLHRMT